MDIHSYALRICSKLMQVMLRTPNIPGRSPSVYPPAVLPPHPLFSGWTYPTFRCHFEIQTQELIPTCVNIHSQVDRCHGECGNILHVSAPGYRQIIKTGSIIISSISHFYCPYIFSFRFTHGLSCFKTEASGVNYISAYSSVGKLPSISAK